MQRKLPTRLIAIASSNWWSGYILISPVALSRPTVLAALATPAQLTSTRSCPCASRALANAAATFSSLVTSASQKMPPISAATRSPLSESRSNTATLAPRRASSRAVASPSPDAAPVTTADIPWMSMLALRCASEFGAYAMEIGDHQEAAEASEVVPRGHNPAPLTVQSPCRGLEATDFPAAAWQFPQRAPIRALFILASLEDRHEIAASSIHRLR